MWTIFSLALAADHANHFEDVDPSGKEVAVGISDAWARDAEAKIKMHVENQTDDFVLVKLESVSADFGGQVLTTGDDKVKVFGPGDKGARVLDFQGSGLHVEKGALKVDGLYRVDADAPVEKIPDFRLPIAKKSFDTKNLDCSVAGKAKMTTDETTVKFKCQFTGKGLAIVDESKIQVRLEDGQMFGNLSGGESEGVLPLKNFTMKVKLQIERRVVDMQFATLMLVFNDAVRVGTPQEIAMVEVPLTLSAEKTEAANK